MTVKESIETLTDTNLLRCIIKNTNKVFWHGMINNLPEKYYNRIVKSIKARHNDIYDMHILFIHI